MSGGNKVGLVMTDLGVICGAAADTGADAFEFEALNLDSVEAMSGRAPAITRNGTRIAMQWERTDAEAPAKFREEVCVTHRTEADWRLISASLPGMDRDMRVATHNGMPHPAARISLYIVCSDGHLRSDPTITR